MQLISKFNKGFRFLLCVIDIFSKYAWVVPLTAISKNVYIDKLDDIVNEYNNTYLRTIMIKPADVKDNAYIDFEKEVIDKDPNLKLAIM